MTGVVQTYDYFKFRQFYGVNSFKVGYIRCREDERRQQVRLVITSSVADIEVTYVSKF